jgi:hypothetical protein
MNNTTLLSPVKLSNMGSELTEKNKQPSKIIKNNTFSKMIENSESYLKFVERIDEIKMIEENNKHTKKPLNNTCIIS